MIQSLPEDDVPPLAVEVVVLGLPAPLSYRVDAPGERTLVGCEAVIEIGRRRTSGWVVGSRPLDEAIQELAEARKTQEKDRSTASQLAFFETDADRGPTLKPVIELNRVFQPEQLPLFEWMAEYYGASLAEVIDNAVPKRSSGRQLQTVSLVNAEKAHEELESLNRRAPKQAALLEQLLNCEQPVSIAELERSTKGARAALNALLKKGLLVRDTVDARTLLAEQTVSPQLPMYSGVIPQALTPSQENACQQISECLQSGTFHPLLLLGVTGSGKTEVYIRAVQEVLQNGGSALIIVPEISLTPQLLDQLEARLDTRLALLHSQVGATARWGAWEELLDGTCRVAIGARSAIFAPLTNLQLIIVDEEHESSYKQSDGLRYQGRDVAVMRGKIHDATVLLGSATPSFESLLNVQRGRYTLIELPERVSKRPLPKLEVVDLNEIRRKDMPSENISPPLHAAIQSALDAKEQVVILYNKRGFSSYLQCETCSEVVSCPECSVTLTFHKGRKKLLCHYCGKSIPPPSFCGHCRNPDTTAIETDAQGEPLQKQAKLDAIGKLQYRGSGTEHVIEELQQLYPDAVVVRMDRDTVGQKDSYRTILGKMRSGEADMLVGTQMIAKGHDLPGVTLVGIIDADIGLHFPDFRTSERAFQLITQAAGRAGRGNVPGRVLLQTREANHPTIVAATTGRFKAFARYQLEQRKALGYPPVGRLLRLIISSGDRAEAKTAAQQTRMVLGNLKEELPESDRNSLGILGPAPAPHERLRGRYRWHVLVKSPSARVLSQFARSLHTWKKLQKQYSDFRLAIDIDPVEML